MLVCIVLVLSALSSAGGTCAARASTGRSTTPSRYLGLRGDVHGAANDLILIFLGLEILSIPLYVLAGFDHRRGHSGEAAMKYFVLGAFSSAIFVYGIALTYGATGSTNLARDRRLPGPQRATANGVLLAGLGLLMVGFGFKVAAVPFHMWTPDVYQGVARAGGRLHGAVAKAGGFAALLRVLFSTFPSLSNSWQPMIWVLAVALTGRRRGGGARAARHQADAGLLVDQPRRFRAPRGAGGDRQGPAGSLYYLFTYAFMVLGSFALSPRRGPGERATTSSPTAASAAGSPFARLRAVAAAGRPGRRPLHDGLLHEVLRPGGVGRGPS